MAETTLISSIDRNDTYPKYISVTADKCKGYLSITPNNWTAQMFYELPSIKFEIFVDSNGEKVRYKSTCEVIKTYNPAFPVELPWEVCSELLNIPKTCYIAITPLFDLNAVVARNELIKNGIEDGNAWNTQTDTFNITIKFLTD